MTETSTPEPALPAPGPGPTPFWGDPGAVVSPGTGDAGVGEAAVPLPREAPEGDYDGSVATDVESATEDATEDAAGGTTVEDGDHATPGGEGTDGEGTGGEGTDEEGSGADEAESEESDEPDDELDDEAEPEPEPEPEPSPFEVLVEDRLHRAHYAHHLTRAVFTPEEAATAVLVERRAAVWVPTMTLVATVVSAIAAVVLATRLRSDPTDPDGNQLLVVTVTVCLLAAAFATLLRAEVHYERLRPVGRVVRHDVADAYEVVRDAPRRLVQNEAPVPVLRRVVGLLPTAEQLVDALARYALDGGTRVRQHPAYERILRMRAEVEALEMMLEDADQSVLRDPAHGAEATLPKPHQVADFAGLADLAALLTPAEPAPRPDA